MADFVKKADKLVDGVAQVFEKGIQDISKANNLISQSITEDEKKIAAINQEITKLQTEKESKLLGISLMNTKIEENMALINKMSEFTGQTN